MINPDLLNFKTVFLINHSCDFLRSSGEAIHIDQQNKKTDQNVSGGNLPPVKKSYWTCATESVLEYCRIVFDIFSTEKWFSLISVDSEEKILSAWYQEDQSLETLWDIFIQEGPPLKSEPTISSRKFPGLTSAIKMIKMPTPDQKEKMVDNCGRIIFIGCDIRDYLNDWLAQLKDMLETDAADKNNDPIDHCEVIFIDLFPADSACNQDTPNLLINDDSPHKFYYLASAAGRSLSRNLIRLCESHYQLASTTVQDIPMKEEQNTTNSAMYGVELVHRREAHDGLRACGILNKLYLPKSPLSGFSASVGIKWVTPKSSEIELIHCTGVYRATTADVCGRASICLTQFVLSGRCVSLEQQIDCQNTSREVLMLSSHGGVIHLHRLANQRDPLEGRPAISEGCGGRVTDYRITEMADLFRQSRLFPASDRVPYTILPRMRAMQHLERFTRYWPVAISDSVICSKSLNLSPLLELFPKEYLEMDDLAKCHEAINSLLKMEEKNEPLPILVKSRQSLKREEQYRVVLLELEYYLRVYSTLSNQHLEVFNWFMHASGRSDNPSNTTKLTGLSILDKLIHQKLPKSSSSSANITPNSILKRQADNTPLNDSVSKKIKLSPKLQPDSNCLTFKDLCLKKMTSSLKSDEVLANKPAITELYKSLVEEKT